MTAATPAWIDELNSYDPGPSDPYHGASLAWNPRTASTSLVLTQEYDTLKLLERLVKDVKFIVNAREEMHFVKSSSSKDGPDWISPKIERGLVSIFKTDQTELESIHPGHTFNPFIEALRTTMWTHPKLAHLADWHSTLSHDEQAEFRAEAIKFCFALRAACKTPEFGRTLSKFVRRCRKNQYGSERYIDSLFRNKGCRHLILRLEMSYSADKLRGGAVNTVTEGQARSDFAKWLRWVRQSFPMTGYIWKLEYGTHRGYHFHVIVFMNGHLEQSEHLRIMDLGEHWMEQITEGQGLYFNCNAQTYLRDGTGMIDHSDSRKIAYLKNDVVNYLTKTDFWIAANGGKWFGKGHMPEDRNPLAKYPGRPRTRLGSDDKQVEIGLPDRGAYFHEPVTDGAP